MPVRRHFLPWDKPLLPQAVAFLAAEWKGAGPLDLSRVLVVVPTMQSGRRLREALAAHAGSRGQAAFPPRVWMPDALAAPEPAARAASRLESLLAWVEVLRATDFSTCRAIFPVDPPSRSFAWSLGVASSLLGVQATLAEAGLRIASVPSAASKDEADFPEMERWTQLAGMERRYDEWLRKRGLTDAQAAKIEASLQPPALVDTERIVVIGTPDPLPLAVTALSAHARILIVDVLVFAPDSEGAGFDDWGRPIAPYWENRIPHIPDFEARVRLCADPSEQAGEIAALAKGYGFPDGLLAVGMADAGLASSLESALRRSGFEVFNPEGLSRRQDELYHLLAALAGFRGKPDFDAVAALARCPAFIEFLRVRFGGGFSAAQWLAGLDDLRLRHLPATLAGAIGRAEKMREFPALAPALSAMEEVCASLRSKGFKEGASSALAEIFARRRFHLEREGDARLAESAEAWSEVVRNCSAAGPRMDAADLWELALRLFGESVATGEKAAGAVELLGWLELLWEDSPHLVVAGMNDGCVPESIAGDPFLPEGLRERLGLKTNAARFARDAYMLQALAACRTGGRGRIDLLLGKTSALGDPMKPSRLLLRCADAELPRRVGLLFRPIGPGRPQLPWTRAWRLAPQDAAAPSRASVTSLHDWLACPFRFYLRHVLHMSPFDPAKSELDDLDFGTLCHKVLESMGRRPELCDCTDPAALGDFLSSELDREIRAAFGDDLSLPLIIQREAARQRLRNAAGIQAAQRSEGWRIVEVEKKFEIPVGGLIVSGKIDRVDRHADSGAIRVLDYKTSDKATPPADAHFRKIRANEEVLDWMRCEPAGKGRVWADLQLPFYNHALAAAFPGGVTCGYFNLPKAGGEAGLGIWADYTRELHGSALDCAEGVCGAIRRGEFWPPNERMSGDRDDFASLFHRGAAASVAWEGGKP